jgi:hypothetical protein
MHWMVLYFFGSGSCFSNDSPIYSTVWIKVMPFNWQPGVFYYLDQGHVLQNAQIPENLSHPKVVEGLVLPRLRLGRP